MEYGSFQAEEFGDLQRLVDGLFYDRHTIDRLDLIVQAEILDLAPDLLSLIHICLRSTASKRGRRNSACFFMCSLTASMVGRKRT